MRTRFALLVLPALFALVAPACDDGSSASTTTPDGGTTTIDAGGTIDTADAAACTPKTGFETIVKLDQLGKRYAHETMTLGADDQPRIAFVAYDDANPNASSLYFMKFDLAKCAWTAPTKVDTVENLDDNPTLRETVLVRDAKTNTLGLAYRIDAHLPAPNGDALLMLALSKDDGATWTKEVVVHTENAASDDNVHYHAHPTVALSGGKIVYAYYGHYNIATSCSVSSECDAWSVVTRTGDSGPFTGGIVQAATGNTGGLDLSGSLAIDEDGNAGFAFLSHPDAASHTILVNYLRVGQTKAVPVFDSQGVTSDVPVVALAFEKKQPRVVASLQRTETPTGSNLWFASSMDGQSWAAPTELPLDHADGMGGYLAIAADGKGALSVAAEKQSGTDDHGACGSPKLATSTGGGPFTTCGADRDPAQPLGAVGAYVSLAYTAAGKRVLAFDVPTANDPAYPAGVVVWREP